MSESPPPDKAAASGGLIGARTVLACSVVVVLAVAALLLPHGANRSGEGLFLVVDPLGESRGQDAFGPLADWLVSGTGRPVRMQVVTDLVGFSGRDLEEVELILCPDGVATGLSPEQFICLAAARRHPPHNLRTKSVLVHRRGVEIPGDPGRLSPDRCILGDSLSLAGSGVVCRQATRGIDGGAPSSWRRGWVFGPDPYDHAPVLHALRVGCFDFAVVRKVAADRFFSAGLLDPDGWGIEELTGPLPDVVVLAARRLPAPVRVRLGEILVGLGRHADSASRSELEVLRGLSLVGLDGFNLLFDPDFQGVRRRFDSCWPAGGS